MTGGWVGARNENPGSSEYRWVSDNSLVNTSLYMWASGQPNSYTTWSALIEYSSWTGGWVGDQSRDATWFPVCEARMLYLSKKMNTAIIIEHES